MTFQFSNWFLSRPRTKHQKKLVTDGVLQKTCDVFWPRIHVRGPRYLRVRTRLTSPLTQTCGHTTGGAAYQVSLSILQVRTREGRQLGGSHKLVIISVLQPFRPGFGHFEPIDLSFGRSPVRPQSHLTTKSHSQPRTFHEENGSSSIPISDYS